MADLRQFIIPVDLENIVERGIESENEKSRTKDLVFLDSWSEVSSLDGYEREKDRATSPTDYALVNGAYQATPWYDRTKIGKISHCYWLRSPSYFAGEVDRAMVVNIDGSFNATTAIATIHGICPALHLDLESIISTRRALHNFFQLSEVRDKNGNVIYHTAKFGEYPKTKAKNSDAIEEAFSRGSSDIEPTGKRYTGFMSIDRTFVKNIEYKYCGQKYVRVKLNTPQRGYYEDGTRMPSYDNGDVYVWIKVEPVTWIIRNWDDMPLSINPKGTGKAKFIDMRTEEAIMSGIPFYPHFSDENISLWQNSSIRGFLNGIDVCNIKTNGNVKYTAPCGGNFEGHGFLQEAFDLDIGLGIDKVRVIESRRKTRLERINPDKTPESQRRKMTDTEIIKSWIDAGQSVLLRGPSGIGKTERIKTLYPDLIYIKLTNNMFPEKVVGSMNLQTGQSIPPDFAKQALLSCATEEERKLINENIQNLYVYADQIYERSKTSSGKIVILLDELLNVKPAVQSLVYTLVLNKLVETSKGLKLPANTVVVATGNQKKYSGVAEDLAEPLEKRFDHILDMEPKVGEWIYEYAIPNKIHPSVIGYIFSKYQQNRRSEQTSNMRYFYEEPEVGETHLDKNGCKGRTNDPRGWVSISRMLYSFENDLASGKFVGKDVADLLQTSIDSKLRDEWSSEFFDFYNNPTLSVDEVVEKRYSQADLPKNIKEKFATMAGLLSANEKQVGAVRDFIKKHCDPEYLSVYDIYWAGHDEQKMEKIAELQEMNMTNKGELTL